MAEETGRGERAAAEETKPETPVWADLLACPRCKSAAALEAESVVCANPECARRYPVVRGRPVLICEERSVFSVADYEKNPDRFERPTQRRGFAPSRLIPTLDLNVRCDANFERLRELLCAASASPIVLVVGSGTGSGYGVERLLSGSRVRLINLDAEAGSTMDIAADAHDLPLRDGTVDAVVVQAVLEHVMYPERVVEEIHRVLKADGLVYAESPFMQQVHGGRHDFTRFTCLGQRKLFRRFRLIGMGAMCGPGMALSWAWAHFLMGFFRGRRLRRWALLFARATSFWLKYFDSVLCRRPGGVDAASGCYFLGSRLPEPVPDREILGDFVGVE